VITVDEVTARAKQIDDLDQQRKAAEEQMKTQPRPATRTSASAAGEDARGDAQEQMLALESKETGKTRSSRRGERQGQDRRGDRRRRRRLLHAGRPSARQPPPKETIAGQIKTFLQQQKMETARNAYLRVAQAGKVRGRVEIATEGHPAKGPTTAPVTIGEGPLRGPYCRRVVLTLQQIQVKWRQGADCLRAFPIDSLHSAPGRRLKLLRR
jgi:hypothetical protein